MRRIVLLITVAAFMAATMVLPSAASAGPPTDPPTNNNAACFDDYAQLPGLTPPGALVRTAATALAQVPGGNEHVAQLLNLIRPEVCP